MLVISCGSSI
ncbi:hypothetical protein AZE42_11408, partial [Rhizopogon vesiculosus]